MDILYSKSDKAYGSLSVIERYYYVVKAGDNFLAFKTKIYKSWWVSVECNMQTEYFSKLEDAINWLSEIPV